jgi:hypothetical protein
MTVGARLRRRRSLPKVNVRGPGPVARSLEGPSPVTLRCRPGFVPAAGSHNREGRATSQVPATSVETEPRQHARRRQME